MRRVSVWLGAVALIVLASRTVAYALQPSPLARTLQSGVGGPRLWVVSVVALVVCLAVAVAVVWLAALGVEERRRLERAPAARPPLRLALVPVRAFGLTVASTMLFVLLESTLHLRAGLGWHGLSCIGGPVHRNALPILAGLSLVAAAAATAVEHVVAWLRRTLARLAPVSFLDHAIRFVAQCRRAVAAGAPVALAARGPPLGL